MRADAIGMFWEDRPVIKVKKEKPVITPPEPVWLKPDYLPNLAKARALTYERPTTAELMAWRGQRVIFDCEVYPNYFLAAFKFLDSGKVLLFEKKRGHALDHEGLVWMLKNYCIVGFNIKGYDFPVAALAAAQKSTDIIFLAGSRIIEQREHGYKVLKDCRVKALENIDYIDLIEVCPLQASLKMYALRTHAPLGQDLPFPPGTELSDDQIDITRWYCLNDLNNTAWIHNGLKKELDLREVLSGDYRVDLRSKSDAQIAEAVITAELKKILGRNPDKQKVQPGWTFKYKVPDYLQFRTKALQDVLERVKAANFTVQEDGTIALPPELEGFQVAIGKQKYTMGIGGLHSTEKRTVQVASDGYSLVDRDVESYYPRIALNQGLYPQHLTPAFLAVFDTIVKRRLHAKHTGNKVDAACLKIVINGTFGKLGSPFSMMYAPDLMIQITLSGQLSLLFFIERLEMAGLEVVSANTDGIVIRTHHTQEDALAHVVAQWERETNFVTEETRYAAVLSKDVNNYFAVKYKQDKESKQWLKQLSGVKTKGIYANPWIDPDDVTGQMKKNPTTTICTEALCEFFLKGTPVERTIRQSRDVGKFVSVRNVTGGAYKNGEYFGKTVRWYYAADSDGPIIYAESGKRVPKSEGAKPLMDFTGGFPDDINYDWYIEECNKILVNIGFREAPKKGSKRALSVA